MKEIKLSITYHNKNYSIAANIQHDSDEWILCLHGIKSNKRLFDDIFSRSFFKPSSTSSSQ